MKPVYFDDIGNELSKGPSSGITGFCSWQRLQEVFHDAGELRPDEKLVAWKVDNRGITFTVAMIKD